MQSQIEHEEMLRYYEEQEKPRQPLDYAVQSTSEEEFTDYDLENRDLYPESRGKSKR